MPFTSDARTLPISEARRKIFEISKAVQTPGIAFTLTENGRPSAVIISASEFEAVLDTLEILHEYPSVIQEIHNARKEFSAGRSISLQDFKKTLSMSSSYVSRRPRKQRAKKGLIVKTGAFYFANIS